MIIAGLYFILFLMSLYATHILLFKGRKMKLNYYAALFVSITVVCLAYFAFSAAKNADSALAAAQFTYIDATFMMLFFILCIMDICKININRIFTYVMSVASTFFLMLAFSGGHTDIFIKSYSFYEDNGAGHLTVEYGKLYPLFIAYVIINMLIPLTVVIYSVIKKKKISYKHMIALSLLLIFIISMYFVGGFISLGFDVLPFGYVTMEYVILGIIRKLELYDVGNIAQRTAEESHKFGYLIIDTNKRYASSNDTAKHFFPEIGELEVDRKITNEFITNEFVDWIDVFKQGNTSTKIYERDNKKIACSIREHVADRKNKVLGYLFEFRDDTEQQEFIEKLNDMNDDLEEAVKAAKQASVAKSMFLANMSHEIRTPINAILGMNSIAMRECNDDTVKGYLQDVENASHNLLAILNDILDFSKIEAGKLDIIEDSYEVAKLLKDVIDLIQLKAEDKNLALNIEIDEKIPTVLKGDESRVRQIMVNLLNNSVKYTEKGSVTLVVSVNQYDGENISLYITVKDTGIGIKEEEQSTLFDSFSRADTKKNSNIEGTGLGLAITSRLVNQMNGEISFESTYGEGTTFKVIIPQTVINEEPLGDYKERYESLRRFKKEEVLVDATGLDILVVDDNSVNLKVMEGLLKPTNANVFTCISGKRCLNMIKKKHFDIILLDHMMPEMDGIEVLHEAKNMEDNQCKDSTYVALTANAIAGVREMYISEGFDEYLSKPIESEDLMNFLAGYIEKNITGC